MTITITEMYDHKDLDVYVFLEFCHKVLLSTILFGQSCLS